MESLDVHVRADAVRGAAAEGPLLHTAQPVSTQVLAERPEVTRCRQAATSALVQHL